MCIEKEEKSTIVENKCTSETAGISSFALSHASFPKIWEPRENSVGPELRSVSGINGINTYNRSSQNEFIIIK